MLLPLLLSLVVCAVASFTFPTRLNLAVRPNGKLFITSPESSTLHIVDPAAPNPTFDEVHTFPNVKPDVYVIALVLNDTTITAVPGTVAIWRVDLSSGGPPVVNKAADVPDGMFLDGLSAVPGEPELVLGADTAAGRIWQINLRTGKKTFSRFPISLRGGNVAQAGPIERGAVWAATLPDTLTVFFPPVQGNSMLGQLNALGNPVEFNSPTSVTFGRGEGQQHTLYMTTQAGQLIAVDTTGVRA
ncbi:hypothetical protein B0H16DRAFT_1601784 [Mycena metata]|uniref:Uncharacterized protein n=1 Tax=Mycena metata TaxID=1033252 RepID=A0AAD7MKU7_9AGAR|nr:hypothetical protein B0H16DRAFT_1601784 [Mycena metata]